MCARRQLLQLPDTVAPDYMGGSLLNLMASIGHRFGARDLGGHARLVDESVLGLDDARVVVLLVIDGLGALDLQRRGDGAYLTRHLAATLTSVFPSTTASAITTTLTGLSPAEHGLTGWFIRDPRFGGVFAPLLMQRRDREPMTGWWRARRLFPYPTLFQRMRTRSAMVSHEHILGSPFNVRHGRGLARSYAYSELDELETALASATDDFGGNGGFVYAYHADYDATAHRFGIASEECSTHFQRIDALVERLATRLSGQGGRLLITADHGFIDSPRDRQIRIDAFPALYGCLDGPLWGERRVAYCRVRTGQSARFEQLAEEVFKNKFDIVQAGRLLAADVFGPARIPHPQLAERIGDYVLIGRRGWTVYDTLPNENEHPMIGVHGGATTDEMLIPVCVV